MPRLVVAQRMKREFIFEMRASPVAANDMVCNLCRKPRKLVLGFAPRSLLTHRLLCKPCVVILIIRYRNMRYRFDDPVVTCTPTRGMLNTKCILDRNEHGPSTAVLADFRPKRGPVGRTNSELVALLQF